MLPKRVINFCMLVFLLPLVLSSAALAQKATGPEPTSNKASKVKLMATGKLVKVAASGGETAGWALDLDVLEMLGGKMLTRLALDPAGKELAVFVNKRLEIIGQLEKRVGTDRGEYWVIVVQRIHPLPDK